MPADPGTARIARVFIEEGCISCCLCQDLVPEVFLVRDGQDCVIQPDAVAWFEKRAEQILEAAEDCPVEVIQVESGTG